MKYLGFLFLALSSSVFACWRLEGQFVSGKNAIQINQMVNHDQMYSIASGDLIVNFKVPNNKVFDYEVVQRKNSGLVSISKNKLQLKENKQEVIALPASAPGELKIVLKEI